ncbi:MAG: rhamnulokinase [Spirochaetales bacterium]|nr:rhamnulokinase [Spirochaetales bacterium]
MTTCIAIDFGASSGRVISAKFDGEKIILDEIHRFYNGIYNIDGVDCWDYEKLFGEVITGLKKVKQLGIKPSSVGVDTWGVDFVLIDEAGNLIGKPVAYRDHRTDYSIAEYDEAFSLKKLYKKTGIQQMQFNTIFQLFALSKLDKKQLDCADKILLVPDYFHYLLSGKKLNEYTQASTSSLIDAATMAWDTGLISELGINPQLFCEIARPGRIIGELKDSIIEETGLTGVKVVLPAAHDTASAVVAAPNASENSVFISSGTWSILGAQLDSPICTEEAMRLGYTNEGGADGKILFMTNIMGMWLIQECMKIFEPKIDYHQLDAMIQEVNTDCAIIDVKDQRFLNPKNMVEEIKNYCKESGQQIPQSPGEIGKVIFQSLAISYAQAIKDFEKITGRTINEINIIGGGCQNNYLNQLTADLTNCKVTAGPIEATAIGNVITQLQGLNKIKDIQDAKKIITNSFEVTIFTPQKRENLEKIRFFLEKN